MILLTATSALQAQQHDLEKQKTSDELKKKLNHRPERDDLVERMFTISILLICALVEVAYEGPSSARISHQA